MTPGQPPDHRGPVLFLVLLVLVGLLVLAGGLGARFNPPPAPGDPPPVVPGERQDKGDGRDRQGGERQGGERKDGQRPDREPRERGERRDRADRPVDMPS